MFLLFSSPPPPSRARLQSLGEELNEGLDEGALREQLDDLQARDRAVAEDRAGLEVSCSRWNIIGTSSECHAEHLGSRLLEMRPVAARWLFLLARALPRDTIVRCWPPLCAACSG